MRTHTKEGEPVGLHELRDEFWLRIDVLADLAEKLEPGLKQYEAKALARGLEILRQDWKQFDEAFNPAVERLVQDVKDGKEV